MGRGILSVASLIRAAVAIVAVIIVAGIVLRVAGANGANSVVHDIHQAGRTLVGPFRTLFTLKHPKVSIIVNWGIAAIVWLVAGNLVATLIARIGLAGTRTRTRTAY